jgi:hypothetical protein
VHFVCRRQIFGTIYRDVWIRAMYAECGNLCFGNDSTVMCARISKKHDNLIL